MGCTLVVIVAIYLVLTFVAAWLLSDGFAIACPMSVIGLLAAMWPIILLLVAISVYEEWRYRQRSQ
jgi:EamA domain-containing membrane protein RarD